MVVGTPSGGAEASHSSDPARRPYRDDGRRPPWEPLYFGGDNFDNEYAGVPSAPNNAAADRGQVGAVVGGSEVDADQVEGPGAAAPKLGSDGAEQACAVATQQVSTLDDAARHDIQRVAMCAVETLARRTGVTVSQARSLIAAISDRMTELPADFQYRTAVDRDAEHVSVRVEPGVTVAELAGRVLNEAARLLQLDPAPLTPEQVREQQKAACQVEAELYRQLATGQLGMPYRAEQPATRPVNTGYDERLGDVLNSGDLERAYRFAWALSGLYGQYGIFYRVAFESGGVELNAKIFQGDRDIGSIRWSARRDGADNIVVRFDFLRIRLRADRRQGLLPLHRELLPLFERSDVDRFEVSTTEDGTELWMRLGLIAERHNLKLTWNDDPELLRKSLDFIKWRANLLRPSVSSAAQAKLDEVMAWLEPGHPQLPEPTKLWKELRGVDDEPGLARMVLVNTKVDLVVVRRDAVDGPMALSRSGDDGAGLTAAEGDADLHSLDEALHPLEVGAGSIEVDEDQVEDAVSDAPEPDAARRLASPEPGNAKEALGRLSLGIPFGHKGVPPRPLRMGDHPGGKSRIGGVDAATSGGDDSRGEPVGQRMYRSLGAAARRQSLPLPEGAAHLWHASDEDIRYAVAGMKLSAPTYYRLLTTKYQLNDGSPASFDLAQNLRIAEKDLQSVECDVLDHLVEKLVLNTDFNHQFEDRGSFRM